MTYGEFIDIVQGYHYRLRLEQERDARLACWICNGVGMRSDAVRPHDLIGIWADGRAWSKEDHRKHLEDELRRRKGERKWRDGTR